VLEGIRVVLGLFSQHVVRERHGGTVFDERDRLFALGRGDQVGRPELIVRAPASPVLDLLEERIELSGVVRCAIACLAPSWDYRDGDSETGRADQS
jgi:hypothetical protein